jgi:5-methylcytosine-specific restriction endonuclease McrA
MAKWARTCLTCSNRFIANYGQQKYCCRRCRPSYADPATNNGTICDNCGELVTRYLRPSRLRERKHTFCSKGCFYKYYSKRHPYWRGGYPRCYGDNWLKQRDLARARDEFVCRMCGVSEGELPRELDVHHKIPFRSFGVAGYKEANKLSNLVSLCRPCHTTIENATI